MQDGEKMKLNNNHKIAFTLLYAGAVVSLLYIMSNFVLHTALLYSLMYDLIIFFGYMFVVNLIGLAFRAMRKANMAIPGIYSFIMGNLTQEQASAIARQPDGKTKILMYEFILLRLDILIPAGVVFGVMLYFTLPTLSAQVINELSIGIIYGVFVATYLIFTALQAYLFSIKFSVMLEEEKLNMNDVIAMTLDATL